MHLYVPTFLFQCVTFKIACEDMHEICMNDCEINKLEIGG